MSTDDYPPHVPNQLKTLNACVAKLTEQEEDLRGRVTELESHIQHPDEAYVQRRELRKDLDELRARVNGLHSVAEAVGAIQRQHQKALVLLFQITGPRETGGMNASEYSNALGREWNDLGIEIGAFRPSGAVVNR